MHMIRVGLVILYSLSLLGDDCTKQFSSLNQTQDYLALFGTLREKSALPQDEIIAMLTKIAESKKPINPIPAERSNTVGLYSYSKAFNKTLLSRELNWSVIQKSAVEMIDQIKDEGIIRDNNKKQTEVVFLSNKAGEVILPRQCSTAPAVFKSKNGQRLGLLGLNGEILVIDINKAEIIEKTKLEGVPFPHGQQPTLIDLPNAKKIGIFKDSENIYFVDPESGSVVKKISHVIFKDKDGTVRGINERVNPVIYKKPDGTVVAIYISANDIVRVDIPKGQISVKKISESKNFLCVERQKPGVIKLKNGKTLIMSLGYLNGKVVVYDPETEAIRIIDINNKLVDGSISAFETQDGRLIGVLAGEEVFDLNTGEKLQAFDKKKFNIDMEALDSQIFEDKNTTFAIAMGREGIHVFDPLTAKLLKTIKFRKGSPHFPKIVKLYDGTNVGFVSLYKGWGKPGAFAIFDPITGKIIKEQTIKQHATIPEIIENDDGSLQAIISGSDTLEIFDVVGPPPKGKK